MSCKKFCLLLASCFLVLIGNAPAEERETIAPIAKKVIPSVVTLRVKARGEDEVASPQTPPDAREPDADEVAPSAEHPGFELSGSGVVVDAHRGYIVTTYHVIAAATELMAVLPTGEELRATVVGSDPETDISVLKVSSSNLVEITLGDSSKLEVGDYVVAVGNPFDLGPSVTLGIVSALGRDELGLGPYENFIQTDASLNPGNSGGALVDMNGALIGINSAIIAPAGGNVGVGFAIPVSIVRIVMEKLISEGVVRRGRLGVTVQNLSSILAKALDVQVRNGAVISEVAKGSTADLAGLASGDVIIAVDGMAVTGATGFRNIVGFAPPGQTLKITLMRGRQQMSIGVTLSEDKLSTEPAEATNRVTGEGFLTGVAFSADPNGGSLVVAVDEGSKAAGAGIQTGDVIVSVNRHDVSSPSMLLQAAIGPTEILLLGVRRNGQLWLVAIE
ncbi:PDZ domain-containing protein [Brucella anthropi]|uniref:trypsin-like peptidase domain-containing protein n=1 Tax=Brucella anthropi TaxID=529 RepID=UPI00124E904B|nr:trypsin-like peptidase domain-containing protein [Brucella anthropi]KAB2756924.1 PDZ domain-containing protein [Brucella anthropi]